VLLTMEQQCLRLMGKPLRRDVSVAKLKAGLWMTYAIELSGSLQEFVATIESTGTRSGLARKWLSGDVRPTRQSAQAFDRKKPGALWVFDLPLADLLDTRPITAGAIDRLMAPFASSIPFSRWWFPGDDQLLQQRTVPDAVLPGDTNGLYSRGDIYGLIGIVAVIRQSENLGKEGGHVLACANAYRILPSVYRTKWLREHAALLEECLERLRAKRMYSYMMFDVDWEVIRSQTDDPTFTTQRRLRARDPLTGRYCEPEDPILVSQIVRGAEVKRRLKQRAEWKARKLRR